MIDYLKNKKIIILIGVVVVILIGLLLIFKSDKKYEPIAYNVEPLEVTTTSSYITIDIKGNVKKPGVYKLEEGSIVQDAITAAGGLKKYSYTKNINLAMKLKDEMVIYIYKNSEIDKKEVKTDVTCTTNIIEIIEPTTSTISNESTSNIVNINKASLEELMTLTGVGESKAKAIIEYRNKNSFNSIEDIMNVAGIGESAFAKIKDSITV